ncbi:MAG: hypothetical protein GX610_10365 [Rhodococcus sp.]|nr:hypothetical protein [Rhodococcus sp. (in: high G+C Gram-positive bacteria)]
MITTSTDVADRPQVVGAAPEEERNSALLALVAVPLALATVLTLVLLAFGLPMVSSEPRDLPLGVAGPPAATSQIIERIEAADADAFAVTTYGSEAELVRAIEGREVYGGIVATPEGPRVLTASAASPVVSGALTDMAGAMAAGDTSQPAVEDVVPMPSDDPRGVGFGAALLPMVLGAILPAVAFGFLTGRRGLQIGGVLVYAVLGGLSFAAVLHFGFGTLDGNYLAEAGVLAAVIGAGAVGLLGLRWAAGIAGLALGAASLLLLGNPLSGAATAPEFLASPWQEIGQAFPPGAGAAMLRSVAFFDSAAIAGPAVVLGLWVVVGLLLYLFPRRERA